MCVYMCDSSDLVSMSSVAPPCAAMVMAMQLRMLSQHGLQCADGNGWGEGSVEGGGPGVARSSFKCSGGMRIKVSQVFWGGNHQS